MRTAGFTALAMLARLIVWLVAFFLGEWIAAVAGWGAIMGTRQLFWRLFGAILATFVVMFVVDRLWRNRPAPGSRFFVSEVVDAFIFGFFFGVAFAV
jgi:hypothetical protein